MEDGKFTYWEFVLKGADSKDIQGVELREKIREMAVKAKVSGDVRNVKEDRTVLVRCRTTDEKAKRLFDQIVGLDHPLVRLDAKKSKPRKLSVLEGPVPRFPKGFEVVREDELSEMVWALQGAGKVFGLNEDLRKKKILGALKQAINQIADQADKYRQKPWQSKAFVLTPIDNFICEAPTKDEGLVTQVYDLYQLCMETNNTRHAEDKPGEGKTRELMGQILKLAVKIQKKLNKRRG